MYMYVHYIRVYTHTHVMSHEVYEYTHSSMYTIYVYIYYVRHDKSHRVHTIYTYAYNLKGHERTPVMYEYLHTQVCLVGV